MYRNVWSKSTSSSLSEIFTSYYQWSSFPWAHSCTDLPINCTLYTRSRAVKKMLISLQEPGPVALPSCLRPCLFIITLQVGSCCITEGTLHTDFHCVTQGTENHVLGQKKEWSFSHSALPLVLVIHVCRLHGYFGATSASKPLCPSSVHSHVPGQAVI